MPIRTRSSRRLILGFVFSFLVFLFFAFSVSALEIHYPKVPGMDQTPEDCFELPSEEKLGCYTKYIYHLSLTLSGFLCFIAITSGGVLHLISGGSIGKIKEARERMSAGILGAILLLFSYSILTFLNPALLVVGVKKPEIPEPEMPEITPYVGEEDVYIEIPYGRLIERVNIVAGIANYWSWQVWYEGAEDTMSGHTSLKELTDCLKKLTDECNCADIDTTNCPPPPGQCVGDPCDKTRQTTCEDIDLPENLRESIDKVNTMIPEKNAEFLEVKDTAQQAKEALEYANSRLKFAEALISDSKTTPLNYDSWIGLKDVEKKLLWFYEDVPIQERIEPSGLPTPPQECSADAPYEIVPSCTICGNVLFCYGNAYRLCQTESAIPAPTQENSNWWLDPSTFPSGYVLYNWVVFPVPLGGVHICDSNVYGCANALCSGQGLSELKDDPATFYIQEKGNEDIIPIVENLLSAPPPAIPPPGPIPPVDGDEYPPTPPPPVSHDLQDIAMWVQQQTGVRAALILALLYHESGLRQFPGSGNYPGDFCCNRNNWWKVNNCDNFDKIWNEVGYLYPQYTKYTIKVSAAGYYGGVYNCGGAMGPAQSMPFAWMTYKAEIKLITGKSVVSPWEFQDAFVLAALHLKKRGGADSQKCTDERTAICNYWGDTGCKNYSRYATSVLQRANGIAEEKTAAGKTGWTRCNGGGPPPPPPGGEWQWPIKSPTVLSSNAWDHINRGSVCAWDFTAPCGRSIYPAKPGRVVYAGCNNSGGYGCWVWIDHGAGWKTYYCHMNGASGVYVKNGDYVTTATALGVVGCTGSTSFGPHTHFEVFGPSSTSGCKGRVNPEQIFGNPATIGLSYKPFCRNNACPGCGNPSNCF